MQDVQSPMAAEAIKQEDTNVGQKGQNNRLKVYPSGGASGTPIARQSKGKSTMIITALIWFFIRVLYSLHIADEPRDCPQSITTADLLIVLYYPDNFSDSLRRTLHSTKYIPTVESKLDFSLGLKSQPKGRGLKIWLASCARHHQHPNPKHLYQMAELYESTEDPTDGRELSFCFNDSDMSLPFATFFPIPLNRQQSTEDRSDDRENSFSVDNSGISVPFASFVVIPLSRKRGAQLPFLEILARRSSSSQFLAL